MYGVIWTQQAFIIILSELSMKKNPNYSLSNDAACNTKWNEKKALMTKFWETTVVKLSQYFDNDVRNALLDWPRENYHSRHARWSEGRRAVLSNELWLKKELYLASFKSVVKNRKNKDILGAFCKL